MKQLALFDRVSGSAGLAGRRERFDRDSACLLAMFQDARTTQGRRLRSAKHDVSQLRAVLGEVRVVDATVTLRTLLDHIDLLAQALREPSVIIARATGRARLLAVQRFIRSIGSSLGRNPDDDLAALDARLPAHRSKGWHTTGTLVAGTPGRRRRRGPTLDAADLRRLVDAAGVEDSARAPRDRALVALHCFSGLRPEEIVHLRWEDLATELTVKGHFGLTATVHRGGRRISLLIAKPAAAEVAALAASVGARIEELSGPVLRARGAAGRALSYRAARDVLHDVCRQAGLPIVDAASLRAACAHWLRSQGLSDHEVATVLGLTKVRSVDRLLRHHAALDAQRIVRDTLSR